MRKSFVLASAHECCELVLEEGCGYVGSDRGVEWKRCDKVRESTERDNDACKVDINRRAEVRRCKGMAKYAT